MPTIDPTLDPRMRRERLAVLEERLGHRFADPALLVRALTHSSLGNEGWPSNQRLEFLGDSVLGFLVSERLHRDFPDVQEGGLSALRTQVVSSPALARVAERIQLAEFLAVGKGFQLQGLQSAVADATEAILGAVYLDGGLDAARRLVERLILPPAWGKPLDPGQDPKSLLNLHMQKTAGREARYETVATDGPPHQRRFTVRVLVDSQPIAEGSGNSKKDAEQAAAREALRVLRPSRLGDDEGNAAAP